MSKPKASFVVHAAWLKHGEPVVTILCEADGDILKQAERDSIRQFNTLAPNGYNLCIGGDFPEWSEETRAKMGAAHRGKPKSAEHKAKIAAAHAGKPKSEQTKKRMSDSASKRVGRNDISKHWIGRKQTPEHTAKRVDARRANSVAKRTEDKT